MEVDFPRILCSYALLSGYSRKMYRSNEASMIFYSWGWQALLFWFHGFSWVYGHRGGESSFKKYNWVQAFPAPSHQWTHDVSKECGTANLFMINRSRFASRYLRVVLQRIRLMTCYIGWFYTSRDYECIRSISVDKWDHPKMIYHGYWETNQIRWFYFLTLNLGKPKIRED
ncbi:hypothetical protein OSB04_un001551 [Centaurea solstitialis]|uniref:Uncharacterized protein n=1 Tax=Centaurea solstitialis TaxID=347529 RepID=A0AA38SFY3_9ASTR|nr:hypothetical protein OSB04_un001551 [Centaurea solstitialis]